MTMLDTIEGFLHSTKTPFQHTTHLLAYTAREVARAEHLPTQDITKTVVIHDTSGYGLAVLSGDCLVDLFELRTQLCSDHLRLANESEIAHLFPDCELGAMPPLGNLCGLPVYVDGSLVCQDVIAFNAGTHRDTVHMRYADFARLVNPRILHFARKIEPRSMGACEF